MSARRPALERRPVSFCKRGASFPSSPLHVLSPCTSEGHLGPYTHFARRSDSHARQAVRVKCDKDMPLPDCAAVPTDFSRRHQKEVDMFVTRFRSIPAFTANLTMEMFQKETQC